ncbi:CDP-diacylglycerol--serine O-phosphatidyltransferase [candidate division KSB1 bacterium]
MRKIENTKFLLPNILTVVNMFCGFFSIIEAMQEKFIAASWLIIIASVFDGLDGKIARFTNTKSKFGEEFDSLADLISFGIAPSVLLYTISFKTFGNLGIVLSFIPIVCGAFRLGRFNITSSSEQKRVYLGLPIPVYAVTIASFILFNISIWGKIRLEFFLVPLVLLLSILMASRIKYEKLPRFKLSRNRKNNFSLLYLFTIFLVIAYFKEQGIFPVTIVIVFHGLIRWIINLIRHNSETADVSIYD